MFLIINACKQDDASDLIANFSYNPKVVFVGDTVYFDASAGSHDSGLLYSWDFNNDNKFEVIDSDNIIQTYVFDSAATYFVKLKIKTANNTSANCLKEIEVLDNSDFLSAEIQSESFIADEISVNILSSSTIIKGLRLSDSSHIEIIHFGKYQTGTFAILNGSYYDGQNMLGISDGEIKITEFDSINNIIEGNFELEVDAYSGGSIYIEEGKFHKKW